jgi:tRNA ligase
MQSPPLFKFNLGHIVWNKRIMAVTVDNIELATTAGTNPGQEFISSLSQNTKDRLHITVGTMGQNIPAVEGKSLVKDWRNGVKNDDVRSIDLEGVVAMGRIKGLFN